MLVLWARMAKLVMHTVWFEASYGVVWSLRATGNRRHKHRNCRDSDCYVQVESNIRLDRLKRVAQVNPSFSWLPVIFMKSRYVVLRRVGFSFESTCYDGAHLMSTRTLSLFTRLPVVPSARFMWGLENLAKFDWVDAFGFVAPALSFVFCFVFYYFILLCGSYLPSSVNSIHFKLTC